MIARRTIQFADERPVKIKMPGRVVICEHAPGDGPEAAPTLQFDNPTGDGVPLYTRAGYHDPDGWRRLFIRGLPGQTVVIAVGNDPCLLELFARRRRGGLLSPYNVTYDYDPSKQEGYSDPVLGPEMIDTTGTLIHTVESRGRRALRLGQDSGIHFDEWLFSETLEGTVFMLYSPESNWNWRRMVCIQQTVSFGDSNAIIGASPRNGNFELRHGSSTGLAETDGFTHGPRAAAMSFRQGRQIYMQYHATLGWAITERDISGMEFHQDWKYPRYGTHSGAWYLWRHVVIDKALELEACQDICLAMHKTLD